MKQKQDEKKELKRKYYQIHFAMAEKLGAELKAVSPIKEGLVAVFVYGNPPEFEVREVKGSPMEFIKGLAKEEGITQADLNRVFKREEYD